VQGPLLRYVVAGADAFAADIHHRGLVAWASTVKVRAVVMPGRLRRAVKNGQRWAAAMTVTQDKLDQQSSQQ
jgi:hypothetical protein